MGVDTIEQEDDGILNSELGLLGELERIQVWFDQGPKLLQDESLQGLHDVGGQCHRPVVLGAR